ncbi:MAG TPA: MFS transporter, partial [Anaerolineales bacterium]
LVSSYFAAQFFAGPYLGQLSDRHGRVPLLVFSQIGSAISFFMMAAAGGPAILFAARVVDGITGGNIIVAQAYITDVTPKEKRTEALGYIFAVFGIGFVIGPALGGVLSAWLGPRIPFVIAGAAAMLTAVMSWLLLDETVDRTPAAAGRLQAIKLNPAEIARNLPLVLILIVAFVGQFGMGMLQSTFALFSDAVLFQGYSDEATNLGVGILLAVVGMGQFITQVRLIGPLKRRFGDTRLVILGTTIRAAGLLIFAIVVTPLPGGLAMLLFAVGMGLMMPPLQSLATRTVDETIRGSVLGVYQSSVSLATIISTAIAGVIFSIQPALPYWIGAGLSLVVLIPAFVLLRLSTKGNLNWQEKMAATD